MLGEGGIVQKIYSTARSIEFHIRIPGKTLFLILGRGGGVEGIWRSETRIPSNQRIRDKFLEYLRKHVRGKKLKKIICDENDRIIEFQLYGQNEYLDFYLFYCGRENYFLEARSSDMENYQIRKSWFFKETVRLYSEEIAPFFDLFTEVGRRTKSKLEELAITDEIFLEDDGTACEEVQAKAQSKFLERKFLKISKDVKRLKDYLGLYEGIDTANFMNTTRYEFKGMKVKFEKDWSNEKRRSEIYDRLKRYKKGLSFQKVRLDEVLDQMKELKARGGIARPAKKVVTPIWKHIRSPKAISTQKAGGGFETYRNAKGIQFGFGSSAKSNDALRSSWASAQNIWFHLDGYPSSHCIAKVESISELTSEDMADVASALRDKSNLEILEIPVLFTQVKNLKAVKGAAGKVRYKKEKYLKVVYNKDWSQNLS
jgi:predicted ribosome quality control (RQC) complex YloA/Tae2 family protein